MGLSAKGQEPFFMPSEFQRCVRGTISGCFREKTTGIEGRAVFVMRCGKWDCPICGPKKARKLERRAMKGFLAELSQVKGFDQRYLSKLLTLTVPGVEYRESRTPEEAYRELQDGWRKVVQVLRGKRKDWEYLRVVEPQKDGYPHLHVILTGPGIRDKEIFADIVRLWRDLHGLGFCWINAIRRGGKYLPNRLRGFGSQLRYTLKYLVKGGEIILPGKCRRFTAGKGALEKVEKEREWWGINIRSHTGVEWVVRFVLGIKEALTEEVTWWERKWVPVEGCPF
jgi:hypothetical protein